MRMENEGVQAEETGEMSVGVRGWKMDGIRESECGLNHSEREKRCRRRGRMGG